MPDEGPPPELGVGQLLESSPLPEEDADLLRKALCDATLRARFGECRDALDDLANRLTTEELLRELATLGPDSDDDFTQLTNGVFWFALAASLDQRQHGPPTTPFDAHLELPLPLKVRLTIQGSLVLRLYIALVFMREGVLRNLIERGARARLPCCGRVRRLLNSDFVRWIRNSLSHGAFSDCAAGIVLRDEERVIVATPGFLNWLGTCLMLVQLQALAAGVGKPCVGARSSDRRHRPSRSR